MQQIKMNVPTSMEEDFDIRDERISSAEKEFENALRPLKFNDFRGNLRLWRIFKSS